MFFTFLKRQIHLIQLSRFSRPLYLAPLDPEMAGIVQAYLKEKGVTCVLGDGVKSFFRKSGRLVVSTNAGLEIETGMVILSIGIKPENELAKAAGLDLGERGGIIVDEGMRTSDPDIFAVGDAVETKDLMTGQPAMIALAGPANKQGRIAADNAMGRKSVFRGTLGTAVVKIFDLTVALTGASEKTLKEVDIPYVVSYTHSSSHAGYYPDPKTMSIKLVFSPEDGKILGAQIIGGANCVVCNRLKLVVIKEWLNLFYPKYSYKEGIFKGFKVV